ncbi:MAG: DNA methyltransferase, partial [Thermoguttaceae bacterium]
MAFDLTDTQFTGPALPEPFVKFELENELTKLKLLPKNTGSEGKQLKNDWDVYRRELAKLAVRGGYLHVRNQTIKPLCKHLGYSGEEIQSAPDVETREGREDGGYLLAAPDGAKLRAWTTDFDEDLDAPAKRGQAYRFSHLRIAQRVMLASGERVGLLTNGVELRLLIADPARPDSQVIFTLDPDWKRSREVPDSFRLLLALASPAGLQKIPELVDKARLQQARVTKDLRDQARQAIGRFIQEVLDHPDNRETLERLKSDGRRTTDDGPDSVTSVVRPPSSVAALARALWHEGLIIVYRLLFVLKLESSDDPARSFTFASTSLWRNTFSPSMALARYAPKVLYDGVETGGLLEQGLRGLFRMFHEGVECTELNVKPLGGALFSADATPVLSQLRWGERAVAHLLDQLLWTTPKKKAGERQRVHYGPLDVEDLGRVYEALLELEPGIATEPMCRLRRQKLEVVVPIAQGEKYRPENDGRRTTDDGPEEPDADDASEGDSDNDSPSVARRPSSVVWIEEIPPKRFYLRVGLGRKATGSYYTPHSFVRFLVQETLGPQVAERSPPDNPQPCEILKLKVFDPACGSGHFLVESCRFLGDKLYEAVRLCDEKASELERQEERDGRRKTDDGPDNQTSVARRPSSVDYRRRILDLPDPDDELLRYLPSRAAEGEQAGYSQHRAEALCRRLVAVHCLYGVDKNPLAVELAKLALWLESHAEGMPLTFLDHRIVVGDSLTGPFWNNLITRPSDPKEPIEGVFHQGLTKALEKTLHEAIRYVGDLEATVGISQAEIENKEATKVEMDRALRPFRIIAAAWAGGVMLGPEKCDDLGYADLLKSVAETGDLPEMIGSAGVPPAVVGPADGSASTALAAMIARGLGVAWSAAVSAATAAGGSAAVSA